MKITKEIAIKVRDTVDAGLVKGMGKPIPGSMCIEAAVCFAMGLPHSDEPTCVSPAIRALKIRLNDSDWSSDSARAKGMRRLALVQLGSAEAVDDNEFARRIAEMTIRKIVPIALRATAILHPAAEHKTALEVSAKLCELEGSESAAWSARSAAWSAARSAESAAWSAARSAAWSAESAESAAIDTVLSDFAESVVQVLIEMKAPGCQWLDLVPINP
jgi:hypothetical protein